MKQLNLTDKQYHFLKSLSKQIKHENVILTPQHITANPYFCVYEKDYQYADPGWYFEEGWLGEEGEWVPLDGVFGYIKTLVKEGYDFEDRWFNDILESMLFHRSSRRETKKFIGAYLTKKAAEQHIVENSYHYEDAFVYVESFWRNSEMENLRNLLLEIEFENSSVEVKEVVQL